MLCVLCVNVIDLGFSVKGSCRLLGYGRGGGVTVKRRFSCVLVHFCRAGCWLVNKKAWVRRRVRTRGARCQNPRDGLWAISAWTCNLVWEGHGNMASRLQACWKWVWLIIFFCDNCRIVCGEFGAAIRPVWVRRLPSYKSEQNRSERRVLDRSEKWSDRSGK